ncbi:MAG: tRNA lysidine(34) synthetase TilS [Gammaproteobacteria bacterium]|nr:tRNA lysidine(34) synthetase TilS [Gammaproteobacteria bacterium]
MFTPFHPEQLLPILQRLPATDRYWLAYSGGLDSSVLLHALARLGAALPAPLSVLHVDHGLSLHSAAWSARCREQCAALGLSLHEVRVTVERRQGGVEAAARAARYAAFAERLGTGETLLTAHHQDDQAETLLLQLLRGGGVRGLAAMPPQRPFAAGLLARPLLGFSREALKAYAEAEGLGWVEDPSNFDTVLERNFLRHKLLPLLERRRGGMRPLLARSADHFAEAAGLLDELAAQDLAVVVQERGGAAALSIAALRGLSVARQRNLLRYWLRTLGLAPPDSRNLQRILDELLPAAVDAMPLVSWPGAEVRRYRDRLHAMSPLPLPPPVAWPPLRWGGEAVTRLPAELGVLQMTRVAGHGIREALLAGEVTIGWRRGGEALALPGRGGHHLLKKLYQEAAIPPWERGRRPLLYIDGQLAQVAGLWSDSRFACGANEPGIVFEWLSGSGAGGETAIEMVGENNDN